MKIDLKTIIVLFLVLLCIALLWQISRVNDRSEKMGKMLSEYQHQYGNQKLASDNKAILSKMQYYIEGKTLDDIELEYLNSKAKTPMSKLLTNRPQLFFYISEEGCTSCYLSCLKKVNSLAKKYGSDNVFVLAHFTDEKNLKYLLVNNKIKLNIYTIRKPLNLFQEDNSYPILFLLSKDLRIENAFVTDKSNSDLLDLYLKVVEHKYLKTY